jgi:hypothetical protein
LKKLRQFGLFAQNHAVAFYKKKNAGFFIKKSTAYSGGSDGEQNGRGYERYCLPHGQLSESFYGMIAQEARKT